MLVLKMWRKGNYKFLIIKMFCDVFQGSRIKKTTKKITEHANPAYCIIYLYYNRLNRRNAGIHPGASALKSHPPIVHRPNMKKEQKDKRAQET